MRVLALALMLSSVAASAQSPSLGIGQSPQIPLTANLGAGGNFPLIASPSIVYRTDASYSMVYPDMSGSSGFLRVTSTVALTAPRQLIGPSTTGFCWMIENATIGGQPIIISGVTGAGVSIANGTSVNVCSDGVNYVTPPVASGSGSTAGGNLAIQASDGSGGHVSTGMAAFSGGHGLTDSTAGYFSNMFNTNGANWHVGLAMNTGTPTHSTVTSGSSGNYDLRTNGLFSGVMGFGITGSYLGDYNSIINSYVNMRGGNANGSDEGHYLRAESRTYFCENNLQYCLMWKGTVSSVSQPGGANTPAALTLAITGTGTRMTNDTLLVDETSPITATLTFTATQSASAPLPITLSSPSVTIPVSISGTLNASTAWTPSSYLDVPPVLTTFAITTAGAQSNPGDELCFADSNAAISNPGTPIVSASLTGTTETISAYLMKPHYAGAQVYIGGLCGYAYELTNDTHSGQQYMFEIYGTTSATTAIVGSRSVFASGGYATAGVSGPAKIYPAARIATTSPTVNAAPTGLYAQIIPPPLAIGTSGTFVPFASGAVVANPGFPAQIFKTQQTEVTVDDPYADMQGIFENWNGYGMNWETYRDITFNQAGQGHGPVFEQLQGDVSAYLSMEHQLYGDNSGAHGIPNCGPTFMCIYQWDDNGPPANYIFRTIDANIQYIHNTQTVASCSISGGVITLTPATVFNNTSTYIHVGYNMYLGNFTDGAGGCSDLNFDGNIASLKVLSASPSLITLATTHANYAGSANAGNAYQSQFDLNSGQSNLNLRALTASRVMQNGAQVCDQSGTYACRFPVYTVANLPSAAISGNGTHVDVSDATTFTPGSCVGGGTNRMIAVSDGTSWTCH
jgi:hypothetical protein